MDLDLRLITFRDRCRQRKAALLPRPAPKRPRKKRVPPTEVRRSRRVAGRFAAGTPVKRQQKLLMIQLGLAHEGKVISEESLQAYLHYFDKTMTVGRTFRRALPCSAGRLTHCRLPVWREMTLWSDLRC